MDWERQAFPHLINSYLISTYYLWCPQSSPPPPPRGPEAGGGQPAPLEASAVATIKEQRTVAADLITAYIKMLLFALLICSRLSEKATAKIKGNNSPLTL